MVTTQLKLPLPSTYVTINVVLDADNYVTAWGSDMNGGTDNRTEIVYLPEDDSFFQEMSISAYKLDETTHRLVYVAEKYLASVKEGKLYELDYSCNKAVLAGFDYEIDEVSYHISYSQNKQKLFDEYNKLVSSGVVVSVNWEVMEADKKKILELTKLEFLTLSAYATLIKQNKIDKLNKELTALVNQATTADEVIAITWDSVADYPAPEKPVIDLDGDGVVSQEEYDALLKENKQLHQRVDFNEQALLDAISMLSGMIMEQ